MDDEGEIQGFYRKHGLIDDHGQVTQKGIPFINFGMKLAGRYPHIIQGCFVTRMNGGCPGFVDLVLVREQKVYLTYRTDEYFTGWHFPGKYFIPEKSETLKEICQRIADGETPGITIDSARCIAVSSNAGSERFHDIGHPVAVTWTGEPQGGEWFNLDAPPPEDLLGVHVQYWDCIKRYLETGFTVPFLLYAGRKGA